MMLSHCMQALLTYLLTPWSRLLLEKLTGFAANQEIPHLILLDFITCTILGEEYRSLSSSLCNFLHSPVTPSLLGPNIFLNTLFSNTLSLRSSLNVSDQVSHPYKTTGKITELLGMRTFLELQSCTMFVFNNKQWYYTCTEITKRPYFC